MSTFNTLIPSHEKLLQNTLKHALTNLYPPYSDRPQAPPPPTYSDDLRPPPYSDRPQPPPPPTYSDDLRPPPYSDRPQAPPTYSDDLRPPPYSDRPQAPPTLMTSGPHPTLTDLRPPPYSDRPQAPTLLWWPQVPTLLWQTSGLFWQTKSTTAPYNLPLITGIRNVIWLILSNMSQFLK